MSDAFLELARTGKLPSPSGVGARILSLTQDESATVDDIAAVLARDPALTGRILRVANSAAQAGAQPLTTTKEAAMRLGLRAVSAIAVGFTLVSSNRDGACEGFDYPAYWSRSLATAVTAGAMAREVAPELAPEAFTAGLLFEIGQLAFATVEPTVYAGVLASARGDLPKLRELERQTLGIDYATLGARLIAEWGMPRLIPSALEAAVRGHAAGGSLAEDLLAKLLVTAGRLGRLHVGKLEADWLADDELLVQLAALGCDPLDLAGHLPAIEAEWRELAADLAIKPLPPWDAAGAAREGAAAPEPEGPLVLAVDDDPICLKVLTNCLHRAGHRVAPATSAEEALALALQHEPSVLITDWLMPGMDGLSLCRALRRCEVGRRLFVIVLTGRDDEDACMQAFDAEADDFIQKPFHPRDLIARVDVGLRLAQAQSQLAAGHEAPVAVDDISAADQALGEDSGRDSLTGLPNRIFATSRLATWFEDPSRPLSVIALAIDGIQQVESLLIGQDLTRQLANHIKSELRKDDVITCTSSGAFLLLCPGADLLEAAQLADRLRIGVAAARLGVAGQAGPITISAGVAERTETVTSPATLIRIAEAALELGAIEAPNQVYPAA
jgi:diguanylate cyclase (GGDEF)-like protein